MTKYILFDTETTGISEEDRIIQVGAMIVDEKGRVEVYDELCQCDVPIKIDAMEVHNITPEMLENKPHFKDTVFYKVLNEHNTKDNYLIAHNMPFDLGMLDKEGFKENLKIIDTLRCSKHLYPESPSHRLQYFRYALKLYKKEVAEAKMHNITIKAHDAIGDVLVMKLLLSKLTENVRELYPQLNPMVKLEELTNTPVFIEFFKFGKYKGKKIKDIYQEDKGYLNWMRKKMELDEDMKFTLDKLLGS